MVLNTGMRTDIPAYFPEWFMNRVREGYVLTGNPYNPLTVTKYRIDPEIVDIPAFGTKNPEPLLPYIRELSAFRMCRMVTVNPYGKEPEPNVPDRRTVAESVRRLSAAIGPKADTRRYSPLLFSSHNAPKEFLWKE